MIYRVLGEDNFQKGLQLYFSRHKYGNTQTIDLWNAWKEVSGKPIDKMMSSWTEQMGFPLLEVLNDPFSTGQVELKQSWFLADGSKEAKDDSKVWFCPIIVGTDRGEAPVSFLEQKTGKIECGNLAGASFVKVNFGQHVPVRVLYPESVFQRLVQNVKGIPAEDRIGLLSDTFATCKAGVLDAGFIVDLLSGFKDELNHNVWSELSACMGGLEKIICQGLDDDTPAAFQDFCSKLVLPAFNHVGWDQVASDTDTRKSLRSIVLSLVAKYCYKDPSISGEAVKRCKAFVAEPNNVASLNADIRAAVFDVSVKSAGESMFDELIKAHEMVKDGAAKIHIYGALGKAQSAALRARALEFNLSGSVRSQDLIYIPMAMASSGKDGAEATFSWMQTQYDRIYELIGATSMMMFQNMVRVSGTGFVTQAKAEEVSSFWKAKQVYQNVQKALAQTVENINSNAKFVDRLKNSKAAKASTWSAAMADSRL